MFAVSSRNTRNDKGAGYQTLSENLLKFNDLHELPMPIDIQIPDDGLGIAATLQQHKANGTSLVMSNLTQQN